MVETRLSKARRFVTDHIDFDPNTPENARVRPGGAYVMAIERSLARGGLSTSEELMDFAGTAEQFGLSRHLIKVAHRFYKANRDVIDRNLALQLQ